MMANAGTRFSNFSMHQARAVLLIFALMSALGIALALIPESRPRSIQPRASDAVLYRTIVAHTAQRRGLDGYYSAAIEAQRAQGYPVRPFVTVREPSLALMSSLLGPIRTFITFCVLGLLTVGAFMLRLRTEVTRGVWISASAAFALS